MSLSNKAIKLLQAKDTNYKISDRDGLYVFVRTSGSKVFRYDYRDSQGKRKTKTFGNADDITLLNARKMLLAFKEELVTKIPTLEENKSHKCFKAVALRWFNAQKIKWTPGHATKVWRQLEREVFPAIENEFIDELLAPDFLKILRQLEQRGLGESTHKLKQRLIAIMNFALAEGLVRYNPILGIGAALKAKPSEQHHPILKRTEIGVFLKAIDSTNASLQTKIAVRLIMHTFVRYKELRFAKWNEFDFANAAWEIPPDRMKNRKKHIVPLTPQSLELLELLKWLSKSEYVLSAHIQGNDVISENTLLIAIYKAGYKGKLTIHGLRGTASTILNEEGFNSDVIEKQLSHSSKDKVRAAYNHAQYMPERKQMMVAYSAMIEEKDASLNDLLIEHGINTNSL